jgi:hypothetical protein
MMLTVLVASVALARSRLGAALANGVPLWALVALQAFRLPLELVMARAAREGVMPPEMSLHGYNFDILTGLSAIPVAWALKRQAMPALAAAFSALGLTLLGIVLALAVASSPLVRAFGPHVNTWVAYFPFVYLVTILVPAALIGQLLIIRALLQKMRGHELGTRAT